MSYSIYIGNAIVHWPTADDIRDDLNPGEVYHPWVRVERVERDDAPTFPNDDMTGKSNGRHPGYSQWSEFCKTADLDDLFLGKKKGTFRGYGGRQYADREDNGLMSKHPGCVVITTLHHQQIAAALDRWRSAHPNAVPGFEEPLWNAPPVIEDGHSYMAETKTGVDPILARLIWVEWWFGWALKNCERPALANS